MTHQLHLNGLCKITKRLQSSVNGNPRYELSIGGVTCVTGVDSSYGYSVHCKDGKNVSVLVKKHYGRLTLISPMVS
jgi:hypothetical protein